MNCQPIWTYAKGEQEMQLRIRPLREQWEARGPGLLKRVVKQLPWLTLPDEPVVRLVTPIAGGDGKIVGPNEIEFEAILANPFPTLSEVVRLGWLISCLACDLKGTAALIPPVLVAAEYVELAAFDEQTADLAAREWIGAGAPKGKELYDWWKQNSAYASSQAAWTRSAKEL